MNPSSLDEKLKAFFSPAWKGGKRLHGLKGGARAFFLSRLAALARCPIVAIAPTMREAESLFSDLAFFLGEDDAADPLKKRLHLFPSWEILPLERLSPHPENVAGRLEGLYHLVESRAPVLISTPAALMQQVIPKEIFKNSYVYLVSGQDLARERLVEHLVRWGFQRVPLVEERGDFSVRGAILDLYPPAYLHPIRLEFDGDRLESIREFHPATQRSQGFRQELLVLPVREVTLQRRGEIEEIARRVERRAQEIELVRKEKNALLESLREGVPFVGLEQLVPYFYPALSALFSYLPSDSLIWLDQAARVEAEAERFAGQCWERAARAQEEGRFVPAVESLYLSDTDWREALSAFAQIHTESLDVVPPRGKGADTLLSVRSYLNTDLRLEISAGQSREPTLKPLLERLEEWREERVFFVVPTSADASRLRELLLHYEVPVAQEEQPFPLLLPAAAPSRTLVVGGLTEGFRLPDEHLVLITADEIFGTKRVQRPAPKRTHPSHFITSLSELKQDDYVVHLDHGIGVYRGLKFLRVEGVGGEFLHLEYEGGDRLYLPVDRINLVQKYIGGDGARPALDRLGGTSWERVKAKTRRSVLAMAHELLEIYAAREIHEGHAFSSPDQFYREFEASFEFEETPDQLRAIEDVVKDMEKNKPMDRLICGDVGYGKTEVALRGAFLAVMDGRQVAILAPTTVLAQQHLQTFRHRLRNYPVRVEMLSRFLTPKENQRVLKDLAAGLVDIVIGTHRLLQKDVEFKNLGLVVVDEEHRFGVAHKERLKKLRHLVDVISLTATPIPRTLHMSMVGIRDLSIIETPPLDRLAIRTYITRYDEQVIRDAMLREIQRGGQAFFLHNRVETIDRMAQKLADLVPEAKLAIAHGQMRPRELERVMLDFLENRVQVLVCSAIIESGLDFPNANTIIINRADRFGLAQLYQLRGRIGRSHRRAYAYLLIPGETIMTRDAERRLKALQELDELGGGFKLALHDLEIRGAGNLLGREQSGHISAVGFELYTEMLEQAVRELKGEALKPEVEPEIRLGIPAYFPDHYIPDTNQRLLFYKRLASLGDPQELEAIKEELRDRYGVFSEEVENLFRVMDLRRILKDHLVQQIVYHDARVSLLFHPESPVKVERLLELIGKEKARYRLSPGGRVSFSPNSSSWEGIIPEVIDFLHAVH
ncbi:MAG: transcription-repair coupling factor [Deltaproteobacteria bacterium]|nr:transcription-repair coupling factor [Deltaproteobacteria bacterium]